jgi:hypothetical protein
LCAFLDCRWKPYTSRPVTEREYGKQKERESKYPSKGIHRLHVEDGMKKETGQMKNEILSQTDFEVGESVRLTFDLTEPQSLSSLILQFISLSSHSHSESPCLLLSHLQLRLPPSLLLFPLSSFLLPRITAICVRGRTLLLVNAPPVTSVIVVISLI